MDCFKSRAKNTYYRCFALLVKSKEMENKKAKKVISSRVGLVHAIATCSHCDYYDSMTIQEGTKGLRKRVKKHVKETGHKVTIETGSVYIYSTEDNT